MNGLFAVRLISLDKDAGFLAPARIEVQSLAQIAELKGVGAVNAVTELRAVSQSSNATAWIIPLLYRLSTYGQSQAGA